MTLTLGRKRDKTPLAEATPGDTICGWRMADVTYPDGAVRFAPMRIIWIHPDVPTEPTDLFAFLESPYAAKESTS